MARAFGSPLMKVYVGCVTPLTLLVGLAFVVIGVLSGVQGARRGAPAQGRVVSIEERGPLMAEGPKILEPGRPRSPTERVNYFPVVEFTAADGRSYRFASRIGHGRPQHQIGQLVDVVYDPADAGHAELRSASWTSAGMSLVLTLLGLFAMALGVVPPIIAWSRKRKAAGIA